MLLTDKNGLCKMIHSCVDKYAEVYLDNDKISVYLSKNGAGKESFLRLKVAEYVGNKFLHDSYKTLMVVEE